MQGNREVGVVINGKIRTCYLYFTVPVLIYPPLPPVLF